MQKKSTAILQIVTLDSPKGSHDASYLSNYATINLVNELARLPGVGNAINVFGASEYAMRIWMDPEKAVHVQFGAWDVIKAIQQQNQSVAAGQTGLRHARNAGLPVHDRYRRVCRIRPNSQI